MVKHNRLSDIPLMFCQYITPIFYVIFIMFLMLSACFRVSGHISGPKRPFLVKIIEIITFQVWLHKLRAANVESLMPAQRQYPRHKKLPITGNLVLENLTSEISKAFVKEIDAMAAGWDPKPCCSLRRGCVPKPWQWLEKNEILSVLQLDGKTW